MTSKIPKATPMPIPIDPEDPVTPIVGPGVIGGKDGGIVVGEVGVTTVVTGDD